MEKKDFLTRYLSEKQENYFDNYRNYFLFLIENEEIDFQFLKNLHSENEIIDWIESLNSIYYKYENEINFRDFIFEKTQLKNV